MDFINEYMNLLKLALHSDIDIKWEKEVKWVGIFTTGTRNKFKMELSPINDQLKDHTPYILNFLQWNAEKEENCYCTYCFFATLVL